MEHKGKALIKDIHEVAKQKGWWDTKRPVADIFALFYSELAEALEFERSKNNLAAQGINHLEFYTGTKSVDASIISVSEGVVIGKVELLSNEETEDTKKPDGVLAEIADTIIRIFDFLGSMNSGDRFVDLTEQGHLSLPASEYEVTTLPEMVAVTTLHLSRAFDKIRSNPTAETLSDEILTDFILASRTMDHYADIKGLNYDLSRIIETKHKFNKTRPHKHGGKTL